MHINSDFQTWIFSVTKLYFKSYRESVDFNHFCITLQMIYLKCYKDTNNSNINQWRNKQPFLQTT